jgi:hypothetical protein
MNLNMEQLLKKINYKDQKQVLILNCPDEVKGLLTAFEADVAVHTSIPKETVEFALVFVTKQEQINELTSAIVDKMPGDTILWFAYPKGSSKKYKCDFNRDTGWNALGEHGFEPVRMVAVDTDWSAMRFRRVNYIKKMTRSENMSLSKEGKSRTKK